MSKNTEKVWGTPFSSTPLFPTLDFVTAKPRTRSRRFMPQISLNAKAFCESYKFWTKRTNTTENTNKKAIIALIDNIKSYIIRLNFILSYMTNRISMVLISSVSHPHSTSRKNKFIIIIGIIRSFRPIVSLTMFIVSISI